MAGAHTVDVRLLCCNLSRPVRRNMRFTVLPRIRFSRLVRCYDVFQVSWLSY
jgi:hypothetical protein